MTVESLESFHVLRSHCHRHRPGRLCLRHSRGTARHESRRGREARDAWRHLPQCRLHSLKSPAPCFGAVRGSRPQLRQHGHRGGKPKLDLKTMLAFKDQAVDGNVKGVDFLFKKNKIDSFTGTGRVVSAGKVEVKGN